jgi:hypothetical protein
VGLLGDGGIEIGAALLGSGPDFIIVDDAEIMNSLRNEIATGTPKRKSLLFNLKIVHA